MKNQLNDNILLGIRDELKLNNTINCSLYITICLQA